MCRRGELPVIDNQRAAALVGNGVKSRVDGAVLEYDLAAVVQDARPLLVIGRFERRAPVDGQVGPCVIPDQAVIARNGAWARNREIRVVVQLVGRDRYLRPLAERKHGGVVDLHCLRGRQVEVGGHGDLAAARCQRCGQFLRCCDLHLAAQRLAVQGQRTDAQFADIGLYVPRRLIHRPEPVEVFARIRPADQLPGAGDVDRSLVHVAREIRRGINIPSGSRIARLPVQYLVLMPDGDVLHRALLDTGVLLHRPRETAQCVAARQRHAVGRDVLVE